MQLCAALYSTVYWHVFRNLIIADGRKKKTIVNLYFQLFTGGTAFFRGRKKFQRTRDPKTTPKAVIKFLGILKGKID